MIISRLPSYASLTFNVTIWFLAIAGTQAFAQDQVMWAHAIQMFVSGSDGLAVDPWGNVAICGTADGAIMLPGTTSDLLVPIDGGSGDAFVARYRANGQPAWGYSLGGPELERAHDVAFDGQGNLYVAGYYDSSFDIDPGPGETMLTASGLGSPRNCFIAKFDSAGQFLHVIQLDMVSSLTYDLHMGFDAGNDLYIAGYYRVGIDLVQGPGEVILPANGNFTVAFVAKYDPHGVLLDHMALPAYGSSGVEDMLVEPDGSIVLAGWFDSSIDLDPSADTWLVSGNGFRNMFVRYNADFEVQWYRNIGGGHTTASQRLCRGVNGEVIITGHFRGQLNVPLVNGTTASYFYSWTNDDHYLACLNDDGDVVWFRPLPGGGAGLIVDGLRAQNDGTFLAELSYEQINLDEGVTNFTLQTSGFPNYDMGLARYRMSDGAFLFGHGFPSNSGIEHLELGTYPGTLYMLGEIVGSIDVDLTDGTQLLSPGGYALVKYCEQPRSVQSSVPGDTLELCPTEEEVIVLTGAETFNWYDQPAGGEPIWIGDSITVAWSPDTVTYYVQGSYGDCSAPRLTITVMPCTTPSVTERAARSNIVKISPVPATDQLRIWLTVEGVRIATAQVFDIGGKTQLPVEHMSAENHTLDLRGLAPGSYVLALMLDNGQRYTTTISVVR